MNAIILKGAAYRLHKVAPEPKQLATPDPAYYEAAVTQCGQIISDGHTWVLLSEVLQLRGHKKSISKTVYRSAQVFIWRWLLS
jgi:hypothetical protein